MSDISKKIVGSDAIESLAKQLNTKIKNYVDEKEFISIVPISIDYDTNKGSIDDDVYLEIWTKHPRFILFQNKYYMLEQYKTYEEDGGKDLSDYDFVYGDGHETKLCFKERSDYNFEIKLFEYVDYESHKIAYEHSQENHAPADAQKNSDITQEEIEAKLTGRIYTHNHSRITFDTNAANSAGTVLNGSSLPKDFDRGIQCTFSENQIDNYFNNMTHAVVETIKPYGTIGKGTVAHQWIFPYKNEAARRNKIYTRSILLGESQWGEYAELYTSLNKPTASDIGAAPTTHTHDDIYYTESEVDSKLSTTLDDAKGYVDNQIVNVEKKQYNILENSGLVGREETIITDLSPHNPTMGFITGTGTWGNINEKYQFIVIPITNTGGVLSITANNSYATYFAGLRSYTTPVDKSAVDLSEADGWTSRLTIPKSASKQYNIPDDVRYLVVFVVYNTSDCTPANFYLNIPYGKGRVDILEEKVNVLENGHGLKWLALGDSITEGYYSIINEETEDTESHKSINECYCAWIAKMKGFDLDNKGVGGSGWLKRGTAAAPKLNAREQIDAVNEDGTYVIDFTKYDICTIMWGVNDWKGSQNLGVFEDGINPETESVYGNMRYVIETILSRNPSIKLIVITPVNCRQDTSARPSSADNNWGIGFDFGGHTLDDYYDAIKEVCDYYGIEMIDMTHNSIINRINAEAMLPDKVHPSLDAHRQMGLELSGKILYGC